MELLEMAFIFDRFLQTVFKLKDDEVKLFLKQYNNSDYVKTNIDYYVYDDKDAFKKKLVFSVK